MDEPLPRFLLLLTTASAYLSMALFAPMCPLAHCCAQQTLTMYNVLQYVLHITTNVLNSKNCILCNSKNYILCNSKQIFICMHTTPTHILNPDPTSSHM